MVSQKERPNYNHGISPVNYLITLASSPSKDMAWPRTLEGDVGLQHITHHHHHYHLTITSQAAATTTQIKLVLHTML